MLDYARVKATQVGLDIEFRSGLAERLPFRDDTFDAVTSQLLMWTLLEPAAAVDEWRRVVRPRGRVVAVDRAHDYSANLLDGARLAVLLRRRRAQDSSNYLADPARRAQLPLWPITDASGYETVFVGAGLSTVRVSPVDQIVRLERRHRSWRHRLWPHCPTYLIEGIVPDAFR